MMNACVSFVFCFFSAFHMLHIVSANVSTSLYRSCAPLLHVLLGARLSVNSPRYLLQWHVQVLIVLPPRPHLNANIAATW
jgi:hypothetical protein